MKKNILLLLFLSISMFICAQSTKRAYKSLEKFEYDKAYEAFKKVLSDEPDGVAVHFGIAMILADDNSPFFNIIDAWEHIEAIQGRENELSQEEIEVIGEYFLATETRKTSRPVKKKIEIAIEAAEARLIKFIREENNLEAVYEVLERYPDFKHYDNVIHIRNQFEFRKYEKLNSRAGYEEFVSKFPDAAQVEKANRYRYKMAYEEVKQKNTVSAYDNYIESFPKSEYIQQAIKLRNAAAYEQVKGINTLEAYENFIEQYPNALEIADAKKNQRQLMYEKAKRIKTLEAYNDFIRMYPDGNYYLDVFNLKSGDLGMQSFRDLNFSSPDFKWAKSLDNNEKIEYAKAITESIDGGIIVAGLTRDTETSPSDAWIVKLDTQGKMVWNKTIGQAYEDKVMDVFCTSEGNIIVVGYTQISSDSSAYMGWMFMLSNEGKKLWNKNLGEIGIAACAISPDDKIYLTTFNTDTVPDNYSIEAYNMEGRKVWEQSYVNKGIFNQILFYNENVFLAGNKWFISANQKFYLNWEDTLRFDADIQMADNNADAVTMVATDSVQYSLINYTLNGDRKWIKNYSFSDSTEVMCDIVFTNNSKNLLMGKDQFGSFIRKYDDAGIPEGEKKLFGTNEFVDMLEMKNGDIVYLISDGNYLVVTFSSIGF